MSTRTTTSNGTTTTTRGTATRKAAPRKTATSKTAATNTAQSTSTADKFSDAAHRAVDNVASHLADAERKLRSEATNKEEALRDAAGKASDKATELKAKTSNYINENPMAAAGIAFAAGILFSAWMRK